MDLPDKLHCFSCGTFLGLSTDDLDFWDCPCGKRLRYTSDGGTREVTPEYLSLRQELDALERRFNEAARQFTITVGASQISPGRKVAPDAANTGCQAEMTLLVLCGFGVFVISHGGYIYGGALILAGIGLTIFLNKDSKRRIAGYRALKAEYDKRRIALLQRLGDC
jgi:hypothetical protein